MGRRLLTVLGATIALAGASAGPAAAGGTITVLPERVNPIYHQVAGPALAGEAFAYAVPVGRAGYSVRLQQPDGTTSSQLVPAKGAGPIGDWESVEDRLAASPQVVALSHNYTTCGGQYGCRLQEYQPIDSTVFAGALGGPLDFRGCTNSAPFPAAVDASGGAIAYLDSCANGAVVHDPTVPESPSRVFPADLYGGDVRIAGRYLAVNVRGLDSSVPPRTITVYDWQSGEVVYKIEADFGLDSFDIQEDGTLAFEAQTSEGAREIDWASPEDPTSHPVASGSGSLRIANGKIAVGSLRSYEVYALDGTKLASTTDLDSTGSFDFDGERLAYVDQPCVVSAIVTWDLSGEPPAMPVGRCPAARAAAPKGFVDLKRRRVDLPVRCPAKPPLGCAGAWNADLGSAPPVVTKFAYVALLPGEKRTVRLGLSRKAACRLTRHPARRATIDLTAFHYFQGRPGPENGTARFKLRYRGHARDCS